MLEIYLWALHVLPLSALRGYATPPGAARLTLYHIFWTKQWQIPPGGGASGLRGPPRLTIRLEAPW